MLNYLTQNNPITINNVNNNYQIMNLKLNSNISTIMTLGLYPNTLNRHMAPTTSVAFCYRLVLIMEKKVVDEHIES